MKLHREVKETETQRKSRGVRIMGQKTPQKERNEEASKNAVFKQEAQLHLYYQVGQVYAFTVSGCFSDQKADGSQHTRYVVKDKRECTHAYYCDCTCFDPKQEILLRVRKISNGRLEFEPSIIERYDEIFIKGEEYEFEVISYQKENGRYVVCDTQIGKNHHLRANNSHLYKQREKLRLEVQGFDEKGDLLLIDRNPPTPAEPCINPMQALAESMGKFQNKEISHSYPNQSLPQSVLSLATQSHLSDTPKIAPSIAIPRENKRELVAVLYKVQKETPAKHAKVEKSAATMSKNVKTEAKEQSLHTEKKNPYERGRILLLRALKLLEQAAQGGHETAKALFDKCKDVLSAPEEQVTQGQSKKKKKKKVSTEEDTQGLQGVAPVCGSRVDRIKEEVSALAPFEQWQIAKYCLAAAAAKNHRKAVELLARMDAEPVIQEVRVECQKAHAVIYAQSEDMAWNADVEAATEVGNSANELIAWDTVACAPNEVEEVATYKVWEQNVLPLEADYTAESGHCPTAETEEHHVAEPVEKEGILRRGWNKIKNFFTGKR